jgi:hypothetical protein
VLRLTTDGDNVDKGVLVAADGTVTNVELGSFGQMWPVPGDSTRAIFMSSQGVSISKGAKTEIMRIVHLTDGAVSPVTLEEHDQRQPPDGAIGWVEALVEPSRAQPRGRHRVRRAGHRVDEPAPSRPSSARSRPSTASSGWPVGSRRDPTGRGATDQLRL